jgi:UDP-N-acetylmuramoyl-L-alanyl-D-glutamate--2,6-diaminopimelate ligase
LAAIHTAEVYGVDLEDCKMGLESAKGISGRMEIIQKTPFEVVVDYAHTPDQLEAVYKSFAGKNLVCVLGSCGGGRDKWKRPILGQIAGTYCKEVFITNEDPYDEDPLSIMEEVAVGVDGHKEEYHIVVDRKEAIKKAISVANSGDVVIITGKGSEPWMCLENGKKVPWDDRQIAREALA